MMVQKTLHDTDKTSKIKRIKKKRDGKTDFKALLLDVTVSDVTVSERMHDSPEQGYA